MASTWAIMGKHTLEAATRLVVVVVDAGVSLVAMALVLVLAA